MIYGGRSSMAEHRTVDARVVGSTPIAHPVFPNRSSVLIKSLRYGGVYLLQLPDTDFPPGSEK